MSATTMNGKPRKQLADQLDRLDGVIDLLADNLNEAVADAARDGARAAVKEILAELLAHPEVRNRVASVPPEPMHQPTAEPPASTPPSVFSRAWGRAKSALAAIRHALADAARTAVNVATLIPATVRRALTTCVEGVRSRVSRIVRSVSAAGPVVPAMAVGLTAGAVAVAAAHACPPAGTVLAGVGVTGTAAAVRLGLWWRSVLRAWTSA